MGNPKRAVLLHLTHSGSQSEHRIHCTSCPLTTLRQGVYLFLAMYEEWQSCIASPSDKQTALKFLTIDHCYT